MTWLSEDLDRFGDTRRIWADRFLAILHRKISEFLFIAFYYPRFAILWIVFFVGPHQSYGWFTPLCYQFLLQKVNSTFILKSSFFGRHYSTQVDLRWWERVIYLENKVASLHISACSATAIPTFHSVKRNWWNFAKLREISQLFDDS